MAAVGSALTEAEVQAIESGYASVVEWSAVGWAKRWNRICFNWGQWLDGRRTADASLLARSVYQRTAWEAIREARWSCTWLGVGAGDARTVLEDKPMQGYPDWAPEDRHRPHNQYLSLVLALGLVGLIAAALGPRARWRWRSLGAVLVLDFERVDRRHAADAGRGHVGLVVLGPARLHPVVPAGAFRIAENLRRGQVQCPFCP